MTTIVFDGHVLAGDKASWSSGIARKCRKVFKIVLINPQGGEEVALVGLMGPEGFARLLLAEYLENAFPTRPDFTPYKDPHDDGPITVALVITRHADGSPRIRTIDSNLVWCEYEETKFCCGAGAEMAWGAIDAGASAVRALEIVQNRSWVAAMGIDYVSFIP